MFNSIVNKTKRKDINFSINYLLIAYAFCLPISKAGTNLFEILIILLWVYQGNWKYKLVQYKSSPLIITFAIFISFSIISIFWANSVLFALDYIAKYRHFLMIPIIYTSLDKKILGHIFSAFLISIFISEIMSYGIFFELWRYKDVLPSDPSPFMDHVSYSIYLAFTSMILLSRVFFESELKYKITYILFFITVTSNLFLNGGRSGQVVFIILLVTLAILNTRQKIKAALLSVLFLFILFLTAYNVSPNFPTRFNQVTTDISQMVEKNNYTGSFTTRVSLWIIGIDEITDSISLGSGIGNEMNQVEYYAQKHNFDITHMKKFADHHNMFITYGVQLGQIGLILILLIFYFTMTLKIEERMYKNLNTVFVIVFALWSFTGTTLHTMNPMTFFALFAGLFNALSIIKEEKV